MLATCMRVFKSIISFGVVSNNAGPADVVKFSSMKVRIKSIFMKRKPQTF